METKSCCKNIYKASEQGHCECLFFLLKEGSFDNKETALNIAIKYGNFDCVKILINNKYASINYGDEFCHHNAVHTASKYGQEEILLFLLEKGGEVNASDSFMMFTPLHFALNKINIIKILLNNGANVNAIAGHEHKTILHRIIEQGEISDEDIVCFNYLLDNNVNIEIKDQYGMTALESAIKNGKQVFIDILLKQTECINNLATSNILDID